jgi:hypothetical protein
MVSLGRWYFWPPRNTTMNIRKIPLVVAAVAALSPALSNASPEKAALTACAQAFASSLGKPGVAAPTFKIAYRGSEIPGSMVDFYSREYSFALQAHDPKTGLTIARASCASDVRGHVVALSPVPLDEVEATLASR